MGKAILVGFGAAARVGINTAMDTGGMRPREEVMAVSRGAKVFGVGPWMGSLEINRQSHKGGIIRSHVHEDHYRL